MRSFVTISFLAIARKNWLHLGSKQAGPKSPPFLRFQTGKLTSQLNAGLVSRVVARMDSANGLVANVPALTERLFPLTVEDGLITM
jgi:hypothetical protein